MSVILLLVLLATPADALEPPAGDEVIGTVRAHVIEPGESLIELAPLYGVGFNEIAAANPRLDPFVPAVGANVIIPTMWVVPAAAAPGTLVVNLSEMRLYVIPRASPARTRRSGGSRSRTPLAFPIGVAAEPRATPLGVLTIVQKTVAPTWRPTRAILEEDPTLPMAVPPGPENPLGSHALRLSTRTILIHGTNRPFGVGRKVSHGCVRLYPEDIRRLFGLVEIGTQVTIVREPVKVGLRRGRIYVEVHEDETVTLDALEEALRLLGDRAVLDRVDLRKLARAARVKSGVPIDVTAEVR